MTNPIERLKNSKKEMRRKHNRIRDKRTLKKKRLPYDPTDDTLGGPTDRWMLPGPWPIGQGHTAIVKVLGDGNHQKCFRQKWLDSYPWMISNEARGLKVMNGVHAPRYICHDATSVTMADAGVHLTAANMPDDWDEQIGTIIQVLKKAGIRHNDIIPRNMMVKDGHITLIDFSMSTFIDGPFPSPWPNKRLLKIIQRDGDAVMLRRAINFILGRQKEWKELQQAIADLGTKRAPGSTTRPGWLYHDVPFNIEQIAHRKHTSKRAAAMANVYDFAGKTGLDLGSSVGGMSFWLNRFGATMTGIECDPQAVGVAKALRRYYALDNLDFRFNRTKKFLKQNHRYDFVCYLSTFMWVLKEEGLEDAKESLRRIGQITDTLFFETSHGDAMAGGAVIKAGLDDKDKMNKLVRECTGLTKMKEIFIDKGWNNRRLVMFTRET